MKKRRKTNKLPWHQRSIIRFALLVCLCYSLQVTGEWLVMIHKMEEFVDRMNTLGALETSERDHAYYEPEKPFLGAPGDIPLTFEAINIPISVVIGGHSGVVVDQQRTVESSGLEAWAENYTKYWRNNWRERYDVVLILRPRGSTIQEANLAVDEAEKMLGKRYDYFFAPTSQWIYCSEVSWAAWKKQGYNLNYDGLHVTPNDLLVSPKTEIIYLRYTDRQGQVKEYYADLPASLP